MNDGRGTLIMVGLTRERTPLPILERASLDRPASRRLLDKLRSTGAVDGAIVLSTCNRTELYAISAPGRALGATEQLRQALAAQTKVSEREFATLTVLRQERPAVEHFLAVVCGLDSAVLGEPEIVAQSRAAIALSRESGMLSDVLSGLADHALAAGRRVRDQTGISRGALSVPSVAVDVAASLVSDLSACRALVVGAGKVGRAVSRHLVSREVGALAVANRSAQAAIAIAQDVGGEAIDFRALPDELRRADVAVCATASPRPLISRSVLEAAALKRESPLIVLDLAVPRDVEPPARRIPGLILRNIDDIHRVATGNLDERRRELPHAWGIVRSETERFFAWASSLVAEPVVAELHRRAQEIRAGELRRMITDSPGLTETEVARLDAITHSVANKLLYEATSRIRRAAMMGASQDEIGALRELHVQRERPVAPSRPAA